MINAIEEIGLEIFNRELEGDEEGEYTYVGHIGNMVIDYVIGDERVKDKVKKLEVEDRVGSSTSDLEKEWDREEKKGRKKKKRERDRMGVEGWKGF